VLNKKILPRPINDVQPSAWMIFSIQTVLII
jgi:hypothetical protein